jgi:amino acid transporter/nucleotide-binding universal stress UspA family protein
MKKLTTEVHLSREMGVMDATLIGVGAMIGAGIFVLTGIAAGVAGPGLVITFGLNGLVALLTACSYAELGSCFHDAGGGYLWVKEGLPKWNGFISGWMSWFAHAVACSLYALGFGAYFELVFNELNVSLPHWGLLSPQKILAVVTAVFFAYVNFRGASETGKVGNLVTIAKIVILAVFIVFGVAILLGKPDWPSAFKPFLPFGWSGVFKAMGLTFIAFQGFEVISQCSEEIKNPKKNIPRAVFMSLAIVIPIYLLIALTSIGTVNPQGATPWAYLAAKKETALVDVARRFFSGGGIMLLVGGLISTMSALNATIFSSSRVAFAMGRDRNFPAFFGKVHGRNFTPHLSILFSLIIVVTMAVSLPIEDVASAADIMFLLLFLQVNVTLIRLRKKRPDLDRGFFTPLFPYLTIAGILMLLFLAVYMFEFSPRAWGVAAVWVVVGLGVYKAYASKREIEHARKVLSLAKLERKEYRILVPLANDKSVRDLATIAKAVVRGNHTEIIFLHVTEVREGEPLIAQAAVSDRAHQLFAKAEAQMVGSGLGARSILSVAHRVSQGIINTVIEEGCNFVVMGREKNPSFLERFFASIIDSVIAKAPCEIAVLHGRLPDEGVKTVLIPFAQNIHTLLAGEIAPAFVEHFGCRIKFVIVFEPETPESQKEERQRQAREFMEANRIEAEIKILHDMDILQGVLHESRSADLLLMGGRSGDFMELLLGRSLTQEITEHSPCPVLWVKEYEERKSFWRTLLSPVRKAGEDHG